MTGSQGGQTAQTGLKSRVQLCLCVRVRAAEGTDFAERSLPLQSSIWLLQRHEGTVDYLAQSPSSESKINGGARCFQACKSVLVCGALFSGVL